MKTFFLAAGLGTRLRPFTETTAKPAIPFLGLPQILYPYFISQELGSDSFIYNTHHNPESVNNVFKTFNIPAVSHFEEKILNSGGGLCHARKSLIDEEHFLLMNADTLFIYDKPDIIKTILKQHISENRLATLFTISKDGCGLDFTGLQADQNKNLIQAGLIKDLYPDLADEEKKLKSNNFSHFIGFYIFSNRIFSYLSNQPDNLIYDILLKIPKSSNPNSTDQKICIEKLENVSWYELGTIKDYKTSHLMLSKLTESDKDSSFTRTHTYFKTKHPDLYPFQNKIEQQILRSI